MASAAIEDYATWQANFSGADLTQYMAEHAEIPIFIVTAYLGLVFYGPTWMATRPAMPCKAFFTLWNLVLATFSMVGTYYTVPVLIDTLINKGFYFSVCAAPQEFYYDGPSGLWVALFVLSKIPELMDTVFLVIQKKDIIFLHWFHHCTVMLYCWHAYVSVIGAGLWFATMNFSVHSIMYSYYFLMNTPMKSLAKKFAHFITTLQLLQMVMGLVVAAIAFLSLQNPQWGKCKADLANSKMGLLMYLSYFVLFAFLYKKLYGKGGKHSKDPSSKPTKPRPEDDSICNAAEVAMASLHAEGGRSYAATAGSSPKKSN